jgi:thiol-disulfide isomerase/thioredoxin
MSMSEPPGAPTTETLSPQGRQSRKHRRTRWLMLCMIVVPAILLLCYVAAYCSLRKRLHLGDDHYSIEFPKLPGGEYFFAPAIAVEFALESAFRQDAQVLLDTALEQARAEEKPVLLVFGATRCLPCRQLEEFFEEISPTLGNHFVTVHIACDAMLNGYSTQSRYREDNHRPQPIPWMVVLDQAGNPLINSDGPDDAFALPQGGDKSRDHFLVMLRRGAPTITDVELQDIDRRAKAFHDRIWAKLR